MIQFFYNYTGYAGRAATSDVERRRQARGASEIWLRKWASKSSTSGAGDRKWAKMRPGRRRTLAVMARALYADAKSRRRVGPGKAIAPTTPPPV